jgi:hypothetical protein
VYCDINRFGFSNILERVCFKRKPGWIGLRFSIKSVNRIQT